jgi:uncharacterized protein
LGIVSPLIISSLRILAVLLCVYGGIGAIIFLAQRSLLYYPTHRVVDSVMEPWRVDGEYWGQVREVANPTGVWLVLHGNGGQAAHRDYLLDQVAPHVAVYVLEYPGYGDRLGRTNQESINEAAATAWQQLRLEHPTLPIGVIGESIGSGPASWLAGQEKPPDKMVLLVPFDQLHKVAAAQFWWLPVKWLMRDDWDNVQALHGYTGEIEIYAAESDEIIPIDRARSLAEAYPEAKFVVMAGGHNSWQWERPFELTPSAGVAIEE